MDRAEGVLLVAEKALSEARIAIQRMDDLPPSRRATSFVVDTAGELVVVYDDGTTTQAGRVLGIDGEPGASVSGASIDADGVLQIQLSDGRTINAGITRGAPGRDAQGLPGPAGRSIVSGAIDDAGCLNLRFSDGSIENVGRAVGPPGKTGRGIERASLNDSGELVLRFSTGNEENLGRIVGRDGANGTDGQPGKSIKGDPGRDGVGVSDAEIKGFDLVLGLTDGRKLNVGRVVGKPGLPGRDGQDGAPGHVVELAEFRSANLAARDLQKLRMADLVVDGNVIARVLTLD